MRRVGYLDYKLVCAQMALDTKPRMVGHKKFNMYLLDKQKFWLQLTRLMEKVVGETEG